jgi:hypothetical protein
MRLRVPSGRRREREAGSMGERRRQITDYRFWISDLGFMISDLLVAGC